MARSRRKTSRGRNRPTPWWLSWPFLRFVGIASLWIGAGWAAWYGLSQMEQNALALQRGRPVRLDWQDAPKWLDEQTLKQITATIALPESATVLDAGLATRVGERLKDSPWIRTLRQVAVLADGRVQISADFRQPLTMVERRGMAYLVDDTGVRLPMQWPLAEVSREWLVIYGVAATMPREPGEKWAGQDLQAGLKLVRFLYRAADGGKAPFFGELRGIDVENFNGYSNPGLRILTENRQVYIRWGLPPGEEYDLEATASEKLAKLRGLYRKYGDTLLAGGPIDLRNKAEVRIGP